MHIKDQTFISKIDRRGLIIQTVANLLQTLMWTLLSKSELVAQWLRTQLQLKRQNLRRGICLTEKLSICAHKKLWWSKNLSQFLNHEKTKEFELLELRETQESETNSGPNGISLRTCLPQETKTLSLRPKIFQGLEIKSRSGEVAKRDAQESQLTFMSRSPDVPLASELTI